MISNHWQGIEEIQVDVFDGIEGFTSESSPTNSDMPDYFDLSNIKYEKPFSFPVWQLPPLQPIFFISKPIKVTLGKEDEHFYAENNTLRIIGEGDSPSRAIDDFCQQVSYYHKYYSNLSWDEVAGYGKKLKEIYNDLFSKVDD